MANVNNDLSINGGGDSQITDSSVQHAKVPRLLYVNNPKDLMSITHNERMSINPVSQRDGLLAGSTIEFKIQHDQFVDLQSCTFNFEMQTRYSTDAKDSAAKIANAGDVIDTISIYYNDTLVESIKYANYWANMILQSGCNQGWYNTSGDVLMGISNRKQCPNRGLRANPDQYVVPLGFYSGFMRSKTYLPLCGNHMRIMITLAPNTTVQSAEVKSGTDVGFYRLNKCSLAVNQVHLQSSYRALIVDMIRGPTGLRYPFTSLGVGEKTCAADTVQTFDVENPYANCLSMFLLHDIPASKVRSAASDFFHIMAAESFPLSNFTKLEVKDASNIPWTPQMGGIQSYADLYANFSLCAHELIDISAEGIIDYTLYTEGYTQAADTTDSKAAFGFCPMAINFEKTITPDDSINGSGVSCKEGHQRFTVQLTTSTALATTDRIRYALAHKRALILDNRSWAVVW
jgi:hypothetical protein